MTAVTGHKVEQSVHRARLARAAGPTRATRSPSPTRNDTPLSTRSPAGEAVSARASSPCPGLAPALWSSSGSSTAGVSCSKSRNRAAAAFATLLPAKTAGRPVHWSITARVAKATTASATPDKR